MIARLGLALMLALVSAPMASAQEEAPLVRVDAVRIEPLRQTAPVIGRLVAARQGELAARINGALKSYEVVVGDRVAAGDVVAVLEQATMLAERDLAAAELAAERASVESAAASAELAGQELDRIERLKNSAAFSQGRFDDARQRFLVAQSDTRQAEAAAEVAVARLRLAEINLYNTKILAEYDGVITERLSVPGAYVRLGDPVVRMTADRGLEIEVQVPFQYLGGLTSGALVAMRLDDQSLHEAEVRAVLPVENPMTRTRSVRLVPYYDGPTSGPLASGQSVIVEVPVGDPRDVVSVHKDAVIQRTSGAIVFVVKDGVAEARVVELGLAVGGRFEVLSNLEPGELAVIRGNERILDGQPVQVSPSDGGTG